MVISSGPFPFFAVKVVASRGLAVIAIFVVAVGMNGRWAVVVNTCVALGFLVFWAPLVELETLKRYYGFLLTLIAGRGVSVVFGWATGSHVSY